MFAEHLQTQTTNHRQHTLELIKKATGQQHFIGTPRLLVDFMDGDHVAATVLNQILYWSERTNDPQGYFWKSYDEWKTELSYGKSRVMRVLFGDQRTQTRKKRLTDIGVEVAHKKAPNGLRINHYRINVELFFAQLVDFLETTYGSLFSENTRNLDEDKSKTEQSNDISVCNADLGKFALQTRASSQCELSSLTENTKSENTSTEINLIERDFIFLKNYENIFGELNKRHLKKLKKQVARLGEMLAKEIIERCAEYGKSWQYVLKALRNENPENQANSSSGKQYLEPVNSKSVFDWEEEQRLYDLNRPPTPVINDRIYTEEISQGMNMSQAWLQVQNNMGRQLDAWRLQKLKLVDYVAEKQTFIFTANNEIDRDFCKNHRLLISEMGKFFYYKLGEIKIVVYTATEWNAIYEKMELIE